MPFSGLGGRIERVWGDHQSTQREVNYTGLRYPPAVMRGLDPRIHRKMDCRVKPGNDEAESTSATAGITFCSFARQEHPDGLPIRLPEN
jgi:hypothetical protein